ncbi:MAG: hypothetical protein AB1601_15455 [Planctomycetota bacterium]
MDELFDRIRAAQPNPLLLTDDELARLEAWLKTHRRRMSMSEMQQAARGDARLRTKLDGESGWWAHLRFTAEYNRNRPKAAPSAGSQLPDAPSAEAVSQGDRPNECGYVGLPADLAAYVPAADILAKHTPAELKISIKELGTILEDYHTNRVRWTRPLGRNGHPVPNRRNVHLGDWTAYVKRRLPAEEDGFPRLTEAELEQRKAAVRDAKHTGK